VALQVPDQRVHVRRNLSRLRVHGDTREAHRRRQLSPARVLWVMTYPRCANPVQKNHNGIAGRAGWRFYRAVQIEPKRPVSCIRVRHIICDSYLAGRWQFMHKLLLRRNGSRKTCNAERKRNELPADSQWTFHTVLDADAKLMIARSVAIATHSAG